ncbi:MULTISPECIES: hypothetical protein [Sanguibacteroides]|nr:MULTISPECIES: hypothetical protein [Sanguibacteroides]PXZ44969.1 hypothetical protein DMB45_00545 [Sanguibacteroides justesenii]
MEIIRRITVFGVLREGVGIGLKNTLSLIAAVFLWILTIWIPYLNVGTTIAIMTIPVALSKGEMISPLFIFEAKYRKYMGEFFTLIGLMSLAIIPALFFVVIPGIVISIGWSLAVYILLDKGVAPGEAMIRSNQATYGYKWTIFGIHFVLGLAFYILLVVFAFIPFIGGILAFILFLIYMVTLLGCIAVIYRNLTV